MVAVIPPPRPGRAALLADMRQLVNTTRTGLEKDPLGLVADRGIIAPLPDVDWSVPGRAATALRARQSAARKVEQQSACTWPL
jgi:hypothetical protein